MILQLRIERVHFEDRGKPYGLIYTYSISRENHIKYKQHIPLTNFTTYEDFTKRNEWWFENSRQMLSVEDALVTTVRFFNENPEKNFSPHIPKKESNNIFGFFICIIALIISLYFNILSYKHI